MAKQDVLHVRVMGRVLRLKENVITKLPLKGRGTVTLKLNRTATVRPGKLITATDTVTIEGERRTPRSAPVPTAAAWTARRVAIQPSVGRWDHRFDGQHATADAILLPDGRVALYYVGASGDRVSDGGPAFRALGVAFSEDGLPPFEKHPTPVITYAGGGQVNREEEGVFSCAAVVVGQTIWVYYGAIEATGPGSVDVFIHVAQSTDGITFTGHRHIPGIDLQGGEVWPFTALYLDGTHYLWVGRRDRIDLLQGEDPYTLTDQQPSGLHPHAQRELGSSVVHRGEGRLAMLYDAPMRVATARIETPTRWTASKQYRMPEGNQGKCWLLDRPRNRWLLYATRPDNQAIRIWSAPTR